MVNENKSETGTATNKNTTVVAVNSRGEPVNAQGQVVTLGAAAPQGVKQTGGGPEGPATGQKIPTQPLKDAKGNEQNLSQTPGKSEPGDGGVAAPNPDDINIKEFIAGSEKETAKIDDKQQKRIEKAADLSKAIDSINNTEKFIFNNVETGEVIGTKFKYKPDTDGKTVYDYAKDPAIAEHITFVIPEDDPQDGTLITKAVSFFWNKPTF